MITISGVGPTLSTFPRRPANDNHSSTGRITALALGADGKRMYAGSWAGVWRSDNAGQTWSQLTWAQPAFTVQEEIPGALYAPHIYDLAASPADPNVVLASALDSQYADGRDGIYRCTDGGANWTLVMPAGNTCNIVFAPDDPQLVYAVTTEATGIIATRSVITSGSSGVVAISHNGGAQWAKKFVGSSLWHIAVGPLEPDGRRRVYAVGDGVVWYSSDGGQTWKMDSGVLPQITNVRSILSDFQTICGGGGMGTFGGSIAYAAGNAAQVLAVEPGNPSRGIHGDKRRGPGAYVLLASRRRWNARQHRLQAAGRRGEPLGRRLQPVRVEQWERAMGVAAGAPGVFRCYHAQRELLRDR